MQLGRRKRALGRVQHYGWLAFEVAAISMLTGFQKERQCLIACKEDDEFGSARLREPSQP